MVIRVIRNNLVLKKPRSRVRTKPRTPTTKNGKFVITFNVLGTPVQDPETQINQANLPTKEK